MKLKQTCLSKIPTSISVYYYNLNVAMQCIFIHGLLYLQLIRQFLIKIIKKVKNQKLIWSLCILNKIKKCFNPNFVKVCVF